MHSASAFCILHLLCICICIARHRSYASMSLEASFMMLLLGHPRLGAESAIFYNTEWAGGHKTRAPEGISTAGGPCPPGAWKIDIRPQNSSWTGQEPSKSTFFRLWRPSRSFREASEVNFAACNADDAFFMPNWTDFNLQMDAAGPQKSRNFVRSPTNFVIFAF